MSSNWWGVVRYSLTVIFAALVAFQQQYPSYHWVAIPIAALGVLGFHAVQTSQQTTVNPDTMAKLLQLGKTLEQTVRPQIYGGAGGSGGASSFVSSGNVVSAGGGTGGAGSSNAPKQGGQLPGGDFPITS